VLNVRHIDARKSRVPMRDTSSIMAARLILD
jgi:hypothetical protein